MDIQTLGDTVEVRITYGNPAWKALRDAGFVWNRPRKCYQAADTPDRRSALEDMQDASDLFEENARSGVGFPLRHPKAFDFRGPLHGLGGRWNPDIKAWVLPSQDAYDRALFLCKTGALKPEPAKRRLTLYTSEKDEAPLRKDGVYLEGAIPDGIFLRALRDATPSRFSGVEYKDHFSGLSITTGYSWTYEVEEVTGQEREQLLS